MNKHSLGGVLSIMCALLLMGCSGSEEPKNHNKDRVAAPAKHEVKIVSSRSLGTLEVRVPGTDEIASVECATCHGMARDVKPANIHKGLQVKHGDLTCNACHSEGDRSTLHLADGREVLFEHTLQLCSQCHGPQTRDYRRGSHGGMRGYWDLSRGPRTRSLCTNCHDPHQPAYPSVRPAPGPRDRFLKAHTSGGGHD